MARAVFCRSSSLVTRATTVRNVRRVAPFSSPVLTNRIPQRIVSANGWFKFGSNGLKADDAGIYASQGRDEYDRDDVEHYFNYMGMLAVEGSYDKLEEMLNTGMHPVDIILLWACQENDTPKVNELLLAGADVTVKNLAGKTPIELAEKPEIIAMLKEYTEKRKTPVS